MCAKIKQNFNKQRCGSIEGSALLEARVIHSFLPPGGRGDYGDSGPQHVSCVEYFFFPVLSLIVEGTRFKDIYA